MRKCHYVWDKKAGKVLIPGCWAVVHTNDMEMCTCRDQVPPSYERFENQEYRKKLKEKDAEIRELEKELAALNRIIKKLLTPLID